MPKQWRTIRLPKAWLDQNRKKRRRELCNVCALLMMKQEVLNAHWLHTCFSVRISVKKRRRTNLWRRPLTLAPWLRLPADAGLQVLKVLGAMWKKVDAAKKEKYQNKATELKKEVRIFSLHMQLNVVVWETQGCGGIAECTIRPGVSTLNASHLLRNYIVLAWMAIFVSFSSIHVHAWICWYLNRCSSAVQVRTFFVWRARTTTVTGDSAQD